VGDIDDRDATAFELGDDAEENLDLVRGKRRGRFIENEHLDVERYGARDLDQLLLADSEIGDERLRRHAQIESLQDGRSVGMKAAVIDEAAARARFATEENVFGDGEMRNQVQLLKHDADAGFERGPRISKSHLAAEHPDNSGVRREHSGKDVHQRRLARAVFAQQRQQPSATHAEGNAVERPDTGKRFGDPFCFEHDVVDLGHHWISALTGTTVRSGPPGSAAESGASLQPAKTTVAPTGAFPRKAGRTFFSTSAFNSAARALNSCKPGTRLTSSRPHPSRTVLPNTGPTRSAIVTGCGISSARWM
jgi:hypothetical protein